MLRHFQSTIMAYIPLLAYTEVVIINTKLNVVKKNINLRKSEVSVERISVCNVIESLAKHCIHQWERVSMAE